MLASHANALARPPAVRAAVRPARPGAARRGMLRRGLLRASVLRAGMLRAGLLGLAALALAACATPRTQIDYVSYEAGLRSLGALRTETAPLDAPFSNADLVGNFARIALRHERDIEKAGSEANAAENPLRRWAGPIRFRVMGLGIERRDRQEVAALMGRVGALTGRPVSRAETEANLLILITTPEERDAVARALTGLHPALGRSFQLWRNSPDIVCAATSLIGGEGDNDILFGLVMIGSEVQGLLRRSCIHEEIIQALGLGNDHPAVRPSIFNDDEEFALLTTHDEWLLRLLYDPALQPGMTEDEAVPIVAELVQQLRPEGPGGPPIPDLGPLVAGKLAPRWQDTLAAKVETSGAAGPAVGETSSRELEEHR